MSIRVCAILYRLVRKVSDPSGETRESEKASQADIRQEIFWEEEQHIKRPFWCM